MPPEAMDLSPEEMDMPPGTGSESVRSGEKRRRSTRLTEKQDTDEALAGAFDKMDEDLTEEERKAKERRVQAWATIPKENYPAPLPPEKIQKLFYKLLLPIDFYVTGADVAIEVAREQSSPEKLEQFVLNFKRRFKKAQTAVNEAQKEATEARRLSKKQKQ